MNLDTLAVSLALDGRFGCACARSDDGYAFNVCFICRRRCWCCCVQLGEFTRCSFVSNLSDLNIVCRALDDVIINYHVYPTHTLDG